MKTRTRELAKPGIYGTVDNPTVVNESDLREIAETFPDIQRAPVSLNGHWPDPSKPRMGNVIAVSYDETTKVLSGTIEEQDSLYDAVEQGFYPDVSIGGRRRASDSKMYLHHLAYLGEEPPAIKDLVASIQGGLEQDAPDAIAAADEAKSCLMIPSVRSKQLHLSDPEATNPKSGPVPGSNPPKEVPPVKTAEELQKELDTATQKITDLTAEATKYKDQLSKLATKYPDEGIQLSDGGDPRVDMLTKQLRDGKKNAVMTAAAGKLPKAKLGLVGTLADHLSIGQNIELSDGERKETVSGLDLLGRVLESIPAMVQPGRIDLSDGSDSGSETVVDMSRIMTKV